MRAYQYHRPRSLLEAFQLKEKFPGAIFVAGGTDLMVRIKNKDVAPPALISLRSIPELAGVEMGDTTRIGAMTTIAELIGHEGLNRRFSVLATAARRLGSAQIRNAATIGGNLCNCSPCADTATPLLVLEARVLLQGPAGIREIPAEEFFVGPGNSCAEQHEILTHILLKRPDENSRAVFMKKGRVRMDLAIASVCVLLRLEGEICTRARVAAGSCAPVPLRLRKVEAFLEDKRLTPDLAAEAGRLAAAETSPISDIRASEAYRRQIIDVYLRRAIGELAGWSGQ